MWLTRANTQSACNSAPVQLTVPATDNSIPAAPAGRLSEAVRKLHVQRGQPEEKIPVPAMQTDVGSTFPVSQRNGPEVLGVNCVPLHSVPPWMRATAAGRAWKAAQDMSPSKVQVLAIDGVKVEQEAGGLRHASMAGVGASRASPVIGTAAFESARTGKSPVAPPKPESVQGGSGGKVGGKMPMGPPDIPDLADYTPSCTEVLFQMVHAPPAEAAAGHPQHEHQKVRAASVKLLYGISAELEQQAQEKSSRLKRVSSKSRVLNWLTIVEAHGGKTAANTNSTRLFIENYKAWLLTCDVECPGQVFPICAEDAGLFILAMRDEAPFVPAKVDRVESSLRLLQLLGARVDIDDWSVLAGPPTKTALNSVSQLHLALARQIPPPKAIELREAWALAAPTDADGMAACPHGDYVRHGVMRMLLGGRGANYAASRFVGEDELRAQGVESLGNVTTICCSEDKSRRLDVMLFLPNMMWSEAGVSPWMAPFSACFSRVGFMFIDHTPREKKGGKSICQPQTYLNRNDAKPELGYKFCAPRKALVAETDARAMALGFTDRRDEMKAAGLDGQHADRQIAATCTKLARWDLTPLGAKFCDILGDWAPPGE